MCDIVIRMSIEEKEVDFLKTLKKIRSQRKDLVSNLGQYIFCHFVLLEYHFGDNLSKNLVLQIEQAMEETAIKRFVDRLDEATKQCRSTICQSR